MDWMFIANVAIVIVALAGAYGAWRWIEATVLTAHFKGSSRGQKSIRGENTRQAQGAREPLTARTKAGDRWRNLP